MKITHDQNGNKTLLISATDLHTSGKGFSIQTLGNLPETHKHGIHYATQGEVFNFVSGFGTKRQKELLQVGSRFTLGDIKNQMKRDRFYNYRAFWKQLNDLDYVEIAQLLGGRYETRNKVKNRLKYSSLDLPKWILESIYNNNGGWCYCAGQCYTTELSIIRKEILR